MFRCIICGFDAYLDDVTIQNQSGRCICFRCFRRTVGAPPAVYLDQKVADTPPRIASVHREADSAAAASWR